jgi:hypothetical protein
MAGGDSERERERDLDINVAESERTVAPRVVSLRIRLPIRDPSQGNQSQSLGVGRRGGQNAASADSAGRCLAPSALGMVACLPCVDVAGAENGRKLAIAAASSRTASLFCTSRVFSSINS